MTTIHHRIPQNGRMSQDTRGVRYGFRIVISGAILSALLISVGIYTVLHAFH